MTAKINFKKQHKIILCLRSENLWCTIFSAAIVAILCLIISNPTRYSKSTLNGLNLFFVCVLPGLFSFMFFTKLLTSLGLVKKLSKKLQPVTQFLFGTGGLSGYAMIISMLSGYPVGAKLICDLFSSGNISQAEASRMTAFCTTSGPIFIIGSVGATMFGSVKIGLIIYFSHILASIMSGIILSFPRKKAPKSNNNTTALSSIASSNASAATASPDSLLASCMMDTVSSILLVGAYITIFFLLSDILCDIGLLGAITKIIEKPLSIFGASNLAGGIVSGILEVTRGCHTLSQTKTIASVCATCGIISFSGLSILLQSHAFLSKCHIKFFQFAAKKLFHAVLSVVVCAVFCAIFGI